GIGGAFIASRPRDVAVHLEVRDDLHDALVFAELAGPEHELGLLRRLVRRRDAGELGDLPGAGLRVQALHVAALALLDRTVDEDLDEVARLHDGAHAVAVAPVRRDERRQVDDAGVGEELCDLADAADVLRPVLGREAEVGVQAVADVVAVEDVRAHAAVPERLFDRDRNRRLARPREAGEPHGAALVAGDLLAIVARDVSRMPDDVRRLALGGRRGAAHEVVLPDVAVGRGAPARPRARRETGRRPGPWSIVIAPGAVNLWRSRTPFRSPPPKRSSAARAAPSPWTSRARISRPFRRAPWRPLGCPFRTSSASRPGRPFAPAHRCGWRARGPCRRTRASGCSARSPGASR